MQCESEPEEPRCEIFLPQPIKLKISEMFKTTNNWKSRGKTGQEEKLAMKVLDQAKKKNNFFLAA